MFWTWTTFCKRVRTGEKTLRMNKINDALAMFDMEVVPGRKNKGV